MDPRVRLPMGRQSCGFHVRGNNTSGSAVPAGPHAHLLTWAPVRPLFDVQECDYDNNTTLDSREFAVRWGCRRVAYQG